jgi:O-antigen ligase
MRVWPDQRTDAQPEAEPPAWGGLDEIVVLLVAATALGHWISGLPLGSFWGLWVLLYVAAVARLAQRSGSEWLSWMLTHQPALSVLLTLAFASCLWSLDPALTVRRAASLLGTTLLGVFIGYSCPPPRLMRGFHWMFILLIVANIAVGLVLPTPVGKGIPAGWRGIMTHKNSLGAAALLATIYFLVMTLSRHIRPLWGAMLCVASLVALVQARSRTSAAALVITLAVSAYLAIRWAPTHRPSRAMLWRMSLALVIIVSVVPFFVGPVASVLGNDNPLNGRTFLWDGALTILRERPLTGYGYAAVWGRSGDTLLRHIPVTSNPASTSAHNSIVNVATELGLPAALVACAYLLAAFRDAGRLFAHRPSAFSAFAFGFLVAVVLVGFMESLLLRIHAFWILFVAITVAVKRSLEATDDRL